MTPTCHRDTHDNNMSPTMTLKQSINRAIKRVDYRIFTHVSNSTKIVKVAQETPELESKTHRHVFWFTVYYKHINRNRRSEVETI